MNEWRPSPDATTHASAWAAHELGPIWYGAEVVPGILAETQHVVLFSGYGKEHLRFPVEHLPQVLSTLQAMTAAAPYPSGQQ